jgi:hypothetical protein
MARAGLKKNLLYPRENSESENRDIYCFYQCFDICLLCQSSRVGSDAPDGSRRACCNPIGLAAGRSTKSGFDE